MIYCKQCGQVIEDMSLKKCPKCNTTVGKGGRFCSACGKKLNPGESCDCTVKTEKSAINEENNTEKCANSPQIPSEKCVNEVKKEEIPVKPAVNRRIAGNPLFEKIAQGDTSEEKTSEIIQAEAVKIVYGKDMTVEKLKEQKIKEIEEQKRIEEQNRLKEEQDRIEKLKAENNIKQPISQNQNVPVKNQSSNVPDNPLNKKPDIQGSNVNNRQPIVNNGIQNKAAENIVPPSNPTNVQFTGSQGYIPNEAKQPSYAVQNKPVATYNQGYNNSNYNNQNYPVVNNRQNSMQGNIQNNIPVQQNSEQNNIRNNMPIQNNVPNTVPSDNIGNNASNEDSKQIFPNAFSQENMQYKDNKQYGNMQHGPTSGSPKSIEKYSEKPFDGMWVAGLIAAIASLFVYDKTLYYICISIAFVFGLIDILLNNRKTGVGVVLGSIVILIMNLLQKGGGM